MREGGVDGDNNHDSDGAINNSIGYYDKVMRPSDIDNGVDASPPLPPPLSESSMARKMRGLKKCRRKFTRTLEGPKGTNQKSFSGLDYAAFQEEHNMQVNDNAQQVHAMITPAKARSPLLKVRMECHALRASFEASAKKQRRLQAKSQWDKKKISDLKTDNNQLLQDIL